MCCFSRAVTEVAETNLFARASTGERQFLVYQMALRAAEPLAMILPLPVPPRPAEDAVRFLDFSSYPGFFTDLHKPFAPRPATRTGGGGAAQPLPEPRLAVHRVGSFEASFVPTLDDFARLDERFRLPSAVWPEGYADWGFAVFKLAAAPEGAAVEPLAMELPRRDPSRLYFPTVHIHDGTLHPAAHYDHNLFFQHPDEGVVLAVGGHGRRAGSSLMPVRQFASPLHARGVLDEDLPIQVARFAGELPNRDARSIPGHPDALDWWKGEPLAPARAAALLLELVTASDDSAAATLAELLPSRMQQSSYGEGYRYAAPEWARMEGSDERSDVYGLGALLFHLVSGRAPFGEHMQALVGHLSEPVPTLDLPLDAVIGRAMKKDPAERHPTLAALADALRPFI